MEKVAALGLDIGRKRIGVAGCDGLGLMATGLTTLKRTGFDRVVCELQQIVIDREIQILVVGLPYSTNGTIGSQAREIKKFAIRLAKALQLPLEFTDECLSSVEAEELLRDRCRSPSRHKAEIDRVAAALILQRWLNQRSVATLQFKIQNSEFKI